MGSGAGLRLALTGDSMITRGAMVEQDAATLGLRELIQTADLAFTNLEVLPNDFRGYPAAGTGGTHLAAASTVVDELLDIGFDLFGTATNHALDYSIEGVLATLEILERKGAVQAGLGRNLAEARMPVYVDHPAASVALLACCSSFEPGWQAGEQTAEMQGRPGLNPLGYDLVYDITPDQLTALRTIAEDLGIEQHRQYIIQLGFGFPPASPDIFPFLGTNFRAAERPAVRTTPRARDVEAIAAWVREARGRADLVIVSLHAHEQGANVEEPAEFIPAFCRQMIDEGADLIVGHGPHLLRGIEVYKGKPIFYSLGNFIAQNDLVYKIPADSYDRFRVDPSEKPGALFARRSDHGRKSFAADPRYWESVVPLCHFDGNQLREVELVPITLGHGQPVYRRGRPRLAEGDAATSILERLAAMSAPFDTTIEIADGRGRLRLAE